jgi:YqaJ-like viral recombinase domain
MLLSDIPERVLILILEKLPLRDIYTFINYDLRVYDAYHKIDFFHIYDQIKEWPRMKQVLAWFNYYYFLPAQGSRQWLAGRGGGIGGSELSTIDDVNPWRKMRELLASKLHLPEGKFDGSIATRWGNIFEPMLQIYVELMINARVYETGNIPGVIRNSQGRRVQNYSPDGVALVQKENFRYLIDNTAQKHSLAQPSNNKKFRDLPDELILLLEFKNPYMRIPKGEIKEHYVSQPKGGMCTIPITEAALFVDGVFRKCAISSFDLGARYDTGFHCRQARRLTYQSAAACGFIGIYNAAKSFENSGDNIDDYSSSDEWALSEEGDDDNHSDRSEPEEKEPEPEPGADMPWLNDEETNKIGRQLASYAIKEIKQSKSDYYKLKFNVSTVVTTVKLLWGFFQNIIETGKFIDYYVPVESATAVIEVAIHRLMKYQLMRQFKTKRIDATMNAIVQQSDSTVHLILPDLLAHLSIGATGDKYDLDNLDFGTDFGCTSTSYGCTPDEFEKLAEKIVDDRHDNGEYKMYHPDKFFFDVESPEAPKLIKSNNYIDYTLDGETSARKWLYQNVEEFINWCKEQNVKPVGILPWKLFEVASMIMYKDPDYLEKTKDKIIKAMDIVDEINNACNDDDVEGREALLSKYYPPKRVRAKKVPTKVQIRKRDRVSKAMQDWAEDFGDSSED